MSDLVADLVLSGSGFLAGAMAVITYARATGQRIEWPWRRRDRRWG